MPEQGSKKVSGCVSCVFPFGILFSCKIVLQNAGKVNTKTKEGDSFRHNRKQKEPSPAEKGDRLRWMRRTAVFQVSKVENLRFSPFELNFCLLFPFFSLDVWKYASRSRTKNSALNQSTLFPFDIRIQ